MLLVDMSQQFRLSRITESTSKVCFFFFTQLLPKRPTMTYVSTGGSNSVPTPKHTVSIRLHSSSILSEASQYQHQKKPATKINTVFNINAIFTLRINQMYKFNYICECHLHYQVQQSSPKLTLLKAHGSQQFYQGDICAKLTLKANITSYFPHYRYPSHNSNKQYSQHVVKP